MLLGVVLRGGGIEGAGERKRGEDAKTAGQCHPHA
jgi:hypothetical protein